MLAERIKKVRETLNLGTQKEFSERVKFPYSRVQDIERGKVKELKAVEIEMLQELFRINSWWLLTGKGSMFVESNNSNTQTVNGNGNNLVGGNSTNSFNTNAPITSEVVNEDIVEIPYLAHTYASAGAGAINYEEFPIAMSFDRAFLKTQLNITHYKNLHVINSSGDSMHPTIKEGELLFVIPFEDDGAVIRSGSIYIIYCRDTILVKRVYNDPFAETITIKSDNKAHEDIIITGEEFKDCKIISRVIGHIGKI